jgi:hypothetical protein
MNKASSPYGFHILLVPDAVAIDNVSHFVLVCSVMWIHERHIWHECLFNIYFQPAIRYDMEVELVHPSYATNGAMGEAST